MWVLIAAIAIIGLILIYALLRALIGGGNGGGDNGIINASDLKGVYKEVSGQKVFITENQLYSVRADGSLEKIPIYYDENYFENNYIVESGAIYRKGENGEKFQVRKQMSEDFENAVSIRDLINSARGWNDILLQSPLAKTVSEYNVLKNNCISKGECDFTGNSLSISNEQKHSGSNALKAYAMSPTASMITSKARFGTEILHFVKGDDVWYEAWYYLEKGRPIAFMELESTWINEWPGVRIRMDENDYLMVEFKDYEKPNYKQEAGKEIAFPRKQWVKVKLHLKLDFENGLIELWQDDKKIISTNAQTLSLPGEIYNTLGFGVTANYHGQDTTLYVDDVRISDRAI
jgi:hypothetical protein